MLFFRVQVIGQYYGTMWYWYQIFVINKCSIYLRRYRDVTTPKCVNFKYVYGLVGSKYWHCITCKELTHWGLVTPTKVLVNIGWDNGLLLGGTKPSPEPLVKSIMSQKREDGILWPEGSTTSYGLTQKCSSHHSSSTTITSISYSNIVMALLKVMIVI